MLNIDGYILLRYIEVDLLGILRVKNEIILIFEKFV